MSEELIKRLRRAAARLDAPRYASDAALLNEAADALSRHAPVQVPEGWRLVRDGDGIIVSKLGIGGVVVWQDSDEARVIPGTILWELANDMLAAAPAPATVATEDVPHAYQYGTALMWPDDLSDEDKREALPLYAVAQGGGVDVEKVIGLVKQYAIAYHYRATGLHAHGMDEAHAAVESAIHALLTPAIASKGEQA